MTKAVIGTFLNAQPSVEHEEYNWRGDLPGTLRLKVAPQYWIWQHEHLGPTMPKKEREEAVRTRFNGFLEHFQETVRNRTAFTNLKPLFDKYEKMMSQSPLNDRIRMLVPYALYGHLIVPEGSPANFSETISKHEAELERCSIETMLLTLLLHEELPWPYPEAKQVHEAYSKQRFSTKAITIPPILEIKMIAELANMAHRLNDQVSYNTLLDMAIDEAAGNIPIQSVLQTAKQAGIEVPHRRIFSLFQEQDDPEPASEPNKATQHSESVPENSTPVPASATEDVGESNGSNEM